jgi:hypothetical protein
LEEHLKRALKETGEMLGAAILDRQETIKKFGPAEIYVGEGGFGDYLAYIFPDRQIVVLESVRHGNALYAFSKDWRAVSHLTKAEIIQGGLHLARIIHSRGWKTILARLMDKSKKP